MGMDIERGIVIIGMHGAFGIIGRALIAAHRLKEDNIHILEKVTPEQLKEYEYFSFARSNRNLDFEKLAMVDYTGYDVKRIKKPVNAEWKRRMRNLQNMV